MQARRDYPTRVMAGGCKPVPLRMLEICFGVGANKRQVAARRFMTLHLIGFTIDRRRT